MRKQAVPPAVRRWVWVLVGVAILAAAGVSFVIRTSSTDAPGGTRRPRAPEVITDHDRETLDAVIEERTGEQSD